MSDQRWDLATIDPVLVSTMLTESLDKIADVGLPDGDGLGDALIGGMKEVLTNEPTLLVGGPLTLGATMLLIGIAIGREQERG